MSNDVPEIIRLAIYASDKYIKSLEADTRAKNSGMRPDFSETEVIIRNYHDWQQYHKRAMEYLTKEKIGPPHE